MQNTTLEYSNFVFLFFFYECRDRFIMKENGYAQIVGRIKETIIRGGENIEPKEIEEVIIQHPNVIDVQVRIILFI